MVGIVGFASVGWPYSIRRAADHLCSLLGKTIKLLLITTRLGCFLYDTLFYK